MEKNLKRLLVFNGEFDLLFRLVTDVINRYDGNGKIARLAEPNGAEVGLFLAAIEAVLNFRDSGAFVGCGKKQ